MRHAHRLTLITSGPTRLNLFARFPKLAKQLGPIRATSPRTATRAAALFRGGWAAKSWDEVLDSPLIIVQDASAQLFDEMIALGEVWRNCSVLACDSEKDLRQLTALETHGAAISHLHMLDQREPLVALSGNNTGIVKARNALTGAGVRCLTIRDGAGPRLLTAIGSLEEKIVAALQDGDKAFQQAGLRHAEARVVGVGAALRALRR